MRGCMGAVWQWKIRLQFKTFAPNVLSGAAVHHMQIFKRKVQD